MLQLRWDHQFQFAGYYAALWEGYYAQAGLDVEIRSAVDPTGIKSAIDEVAAGRADFGIGSADVLIARDEGKPLVVLASVFQSSASAFFHLPDTRLDGLSALTNLKVARRENDLIDVELQAMLVAEGIDPSKVPAHPHSPGLRHLLDGSVDVIPGYRISLPFMAREAGVELRQFLPISYGVNFYGDSLFARSDFARNDPNLARRFVEASARGWRHALDHPEETARRIVDRLERTAPNPGPEDLLDFNLAQAEGVREVTLHPLVEIGHVNPDRWARMEEMLRHAGLLTSGPPDVPLLFDAEAHQRERTRMFTTALAGTAAVFVVLGLVVFAWAASLKIQVSKATRDLNLTQERLERTISALSESNTELERLAFVASHDLQEPVRRVVSFSGLIEKNLGDRLDDPGREYLHHMVEAAKRMRALVEDLLSYSRVKVSAADHAPFALADAVDTATRNLGVAISESGARITTGTLPEIEGDQHQIAMLFQHLISNAIKYRRRGTEARIDIRADRRDGTWIFQVADQGIGIRKRYQKRIFEVFFTIDPTYAYGGTGIGLSICKSIVERHGGRIWIDSKFGRGTTFSFTLPGAKGAS